MSSCAGSINLISLCQFNFYLYLCMTSTHQHSLIQLLQCHSIFCFMFVVCFWFLVTDDLLPQCSMFCDHIILRLTYTSCFSNIYIFSVAMCFKSQHICSYAHSCTLDPKSLDVWGFRKWKELNLQLSFLNFLKCGLLLPL